MTELEVTSRHSPTHTVTPNHNARHLRLKASGTLLVSTDLHGNGEDFRRLESLFFEHVQRDPETEWLILGDLVHGPDVESARDEPALYGYWDESAWIVKRLARLMRAYPTKIHLILGNHDYAHIGGDRTRKFHDDEASFLESQLRPDAYRDLCALFERAYLAASTPSGLLLTHGSPNMSLSALSHLDTIDLSARERSDWECEVLYGLLWAYGQKDEVTRAVLDSCSRELPPSERLRLLIHGHDRAEEGWFTEGEYQLCVVLFGALRAQKRYLVLDRARVYESLDDLTHPNVMRRLYPSLSLIPDVE